MNAGRSTADRAEGSDSEKLSTKQRVFRAMFALVVGMVVLAVTWIVITGLLARSRLNSADDDVHQLKRAVRSGDISQARQLAAHITQDASSAHDLTTGPAWWTAANLPFVGSPLRTARQLAREVQLVSGDALPLLEAGDALNRARRTDAGIDVKSVDRLTSSVGATARSSRRAAEAVAQTSPSWLPLVSNARAELLRSLNKVGGQLSTIDHAATAFTPLLGLDRPQTFFVAFMNEAEARGLGGLPGAFAILTVDQGRFHFTHFGSDTELRKVRSGVDLGAEYAARYGQDDPTNEYVNSDVSPDLRDAARIWSALWEKKSGQHVNAALTLDPTTLGYLLKVTGPATLADGTRVSSGNVVALTESRVYSRYSVDAQRDVFLRNVAAAASKKLLAQGGSNPLRLAGALVTAARQRRFALWSSDGTVEHRIIAAGYGAVLQPSPVFTGFTVVNAAGSKLDYYLSRRMTYTPLSCAPGSTSRATFSLTNHAPKAGLPGYVTTRLDQHPPDVRPGDNRDLVTYYASPGATVEAVTVDGRRVAASTSPEKGLVATTVNVEMPAGATRTVTVTVHEPSPRSRPSILLQPLVRTQTTLIDHRCEPGR